MDPTFVAWIFRKDKKGSVCTSHQKFLTHAEVRRLGMKDDTVWKIVKVREDETEQILFEREEKDLVGSFF